jgi:hypothetical protein
MLVDCDPERTRQAGDAKNVESNDESDCGIVENKEKRKEAQQGCEEEQEEQEVA